MHRDSRKKGINIRTYSQGKPARKGWHLSWVWERWLWTAEEEQECISRPERHSQGSVTWRGCNRGLVSLNGYFCPEELDGLHSEHNRRSANTGETNE